MPAAASSSEPAGRSMRPAEVGIIEHDDQPGTVIGNHPDNGVRLRPYAHIRPF
jgi:hypothetical protein